MATTSKPVPTKAASSVLIAQLARGMRRRVEQAVTPLGLRPRQLVALNHLRERGPSPQQTLIELLGVDPSNMVAVLNDLEDAGLIVRRRDRADRRRAIIELSPEGRELLEELDRALHGIDDEVFSGLTPAERREFNHLLTRAAESAGVSCTQAADESC